MSNSRKASADSSYGSHLQWSSSGDALAAAEADVARGSQPPTDGGGAGGYPPPSRRSHHQYPDSPTMPPAGTFSRHVGESVRPDPEIPHTSLADFKKAHEMREILLSTHPGLKFHWNCSAGHGSVQYNSAFIVGGTAPVQEAIDGLLDSPPSAFVDCYTHGAAQQYNAAYVCHSGAKPLRIPYSREDMYLSCKTVPKTLPDGQVVAGRQHNMVTLSFLDHPNPDPAMAETVVSAVADHPAPLPQAQ